MRLSIERIMIENFKGIRSLEIRFGEKRTEIAGMNGTGKSSIADAFCWVLFNKDSHGNAPGSDYFREKPLDESGNEVHNLDTMVELDCKLDGKAFDLKRVQRENWVRKRGSTNPVFQGNASTYFINDIETALKDFKAKIAEIAPEDVFRLIGSLSAFNAQEWKKRREQLLALSGVDVDERLFATAEYKAVADECATRNITPDELRTALANQRSRMNKDIMMFPVRIDEATHALPTFGAHEVEDAEYIVKDNAETIARIEAQIAEATNEAGKSAALANIAAMESEYNDLMRRVRDEWSDGKRGIEKRIANAAEDERRALTAQTYAQTRIDTLTAQINKATEQRDALRVEYNKAKSERLEMVDETVCPTCGQTLPEATVTATREKAQARFDSEKKVRLSGIAENGKAKGILIEQLTTEREQANAEIETAKANLATAQAARQAADAELSAYPSEPDYGKNPRIAELKTAIASAQKSLTTEPDTQVEALKKRKADLQRQSDEKREIIAKAKTAEDTKKRIAQLEAEQRQAGVKMSELEKLIALAEKFVTDRCAVLEDSINSCFPTVRWKLFDVQINGGITDVCMCMIPCESGLVAYESANTAARVNADLEIINVLSKHYGVELPVFVDGAESVNRLTETDNQTITLSVSTDAELTVKEAI